MTLSLAVEGAVSELSEVQRTQLMDRALTEDSAVATIAAAVIQRVRLDGDTALLQLASELDGVQLQSLEVPKSEWEAAAKALPSDLASALERSARNIARFHSALVPATTKLETEPGVALERRVGPVACAGVYAPGGRASYPSSVLMGAVPARAVGVGEVIVCSPPGANGDVADVVKAACWFASADRLFAIGGAGAVAAMAFGTESVPRVDVLVGPGNAYVNEAKRQLAGTVRIDSPAGPSELLVVADATADPTWVAAEVIAQAEHDADACVGVVCLDSDTAGAIRAALDQALAQAPRQEIAAAALSNHGFLVVADNMDSAVAFSNDYAAEHLSVMTDDPSGFADLMTSSGTIFVGSDSSVAFGDYISGANHVLPTAGASRSFSGLSSEHFLRSYTVQTINPEGARSLAYDTALLADAEGLPGHAAAARLRGAQRDGGPSADVGGGLA